MIIDLFGSRNPRPMLRVGNPGDVGSVEMQDLILTTKGGTAGVVLLEWNVRALGQGSAALWGKSLQELTPRRTSPFECSLTWLKDVHARIGGAIGTDLTHTECPPLESGTNPAKCQAASLLMHITKSASGYFDNMWLWTADHTIEYVPITSHAG